MPEDFFAEISDQKTPPEYKFFNGKEWITSASGKTTEVHSPIDDAIVGRTQIVTHEEIDIVMEKAASGSFAGTFLPVNTAYKRRFSFEGDALK